MWDNTEPEEDSAGFAESPTLCRLALWLYVFAFVGFVMLVVV